MQSWNREDAKRAFYTGETVSGAGLVGKQEGKEGTGFTERHGVDVGKEGREMGGAFGEEVRSGEQ